MTTLELHGPGGDVCRALITIGETRAAGLAARIVPGDRSASGRALPVSAGAEPAGSGFRPADTGFGAASH